MNSLVAMKGPETQLLSCTRHDQTVLLVSYQDGSLGIMADNRLIGIWEYTELDACIASFLQITECSDRSRLPLFGGAPRNNFYTNRHISNYHN